MTTAKVDILVPIYREHFDEEEEAAVKRTFKILGARGISFLAPDNLSLTYYKNTFASAKFRITESQFFDSVRDYSRLLVSERFYSEICHGDFVLIVQPDVYVFSDELDSWLQSPFDYVGAPWPDGIELNISAGKFAEVGGKHLRVHVGNGGFSLRRTKKCAALIREHAEVAAWFTKTGSNEDLFFAFMGMLSKDFVIPNQMTAARFSWELKPEHYHQLLAGQLPMGVHAYLKYSPNFWRELTKKYE